MKFGYKITWLVLTIVIHVGLNVIWKNLKCIHEVPENGKQEFFETPWKESMPSLETPRVCPELDDRSDWTFQCKYKCPTVNTSFILSLPRRLQLVPVCPPSGGGYLQREITSTNSVPVLQFRDPCQTPPKTMSGKVIRFIEHKSDITRIKVLTEYGGIYMDLDTIQLASLDPLRLFSFTMGVESDTALGSFIFLAEKNATFLHLWMKGYDEYLPNNWGYNALTVPSRLSKTHPEMIHIENRRLTTPTYENRHQIFNRNFDWSENLTIHLYIRQFESDFNIATFRTMNNTIGAVSRYVLFGHKELCSQ